MPLHNLRIATPLRGEDKEVIATLLHGMKEESVYKDLLEDKDEVSNTISLYLEDKDSVTILYDNIGFITGKVNKLPFSKELQAYEIAWYVVPDHRSTSVGRELYEAFTHWAINIKKVKVIHTASPSGSNLSSMYTKLGYIKLEEVYIKVL